MVRLSQYYIPERHKGQVYSAFLHLFLLILAITGLPAFLRSTPPMEPSVVSVEILPITGITNIKPAEKPQEKAPEKPAEKKSAKPAPPVKTSEAAPAPKLEAIGKKAEKPKEKDKKNEKKEAKKVPKATEEDLEAVLKAVKATAQEKKNEQATSEANKAKNTSTLYNPALAMSMSEQDAIRSQIAKCWNIPAGAKNAQDLVVTLRISLGEDGSVIKVELADDSKSRYSRDTFFRAAADSAMRAVRQCSPLKDLPPDKYQTWRDMELSFNPKEMLL